MSAGTAFVYLFSSSSLERERESVYRRSVSPLRLVCPRSIAILPESNSLG